MTDMRIRAGLAVLLVCLIVSLAMAQNKPPNFSCAWGFVPDAVSLEIQRTNLIVYIDSTSNPADENKITRLEIEWTGEGGFNEEGCDFDNIFVGDSDICTDAKIAIERPEGVGPVWDAGAIIPEGWYGFRIYDEAGWIVDGSYLTGGGLDKFDADSPYISCIPEPSTLTLLVIGALGLIAVRQRK